ncbi:hypothetical protein DB29_01090 [Shouchella clausii]|nr:hypothetical protein DB29_01090 [Shouchella clausii]
MNRFQFVNKSTNSWPTDEFAELPCFLSLTAGAPNEIGLNWKGT